MRTKSIAVIIFSFLISCNVSFSQNKNDVKHTTKEKSVFEIIGEDFSDSFKDGIKVYTSPLSFKSKNWIISGAVILTSTALYLKDETFRDLAKKNHSDFNDKLADVGKQYGGIIAPAVIGGGIYAGGLIFKDNYTRVTGRMVLESVLYAGIVTTVLKSATGRSRPYTEAGKDFFQPFQFSDNDKMSLPSGHSTVAFAISSVLANRIKNIYASIGLYTLASLTALSRVYHDQHWVSDAFFGSAIGYFIGDYISSNSVSLNKNKKTFMHIYPGIDNLNLIVPF